MEPKAENSTPASNSDADAATETGTTQSKSAFSKLDASNIQDETGINEIESMCVQCYKNGLTKLMLTKIPFYRDIIISSFNCEHCGFNNTGIQSANKVLDYGVKIKLTVRNKADLNREVVKSDLASFKLPSLDFEIQPKTQKAALTTIEGLISGVVTNLEENVATLTKLVEKEGGDEAEKRERKALADQLSAFNDKMKKLLLIEEPFDVIVDDPSGDSFVENPQAPNKDPFLILTHYRRNKEQDEFIGLENEEDKAEEEEEELEPADLNADLKNEVVKFHGNCPNCNAVCDTNMKITDIPYFKEVIIMCTICDVCGVKSSEVKPGTSIEEKGIKFELKVTDTSDLNRDLIKSDFATFEIPEIEFFMDSGTLGGKFTTLEGLCKDAREQLDSICPFSTGDSAANKESEPKNKMVECLEKLDKVAKGELLNVTIVLDDPSGNSYMQNVYAPDDDPNMLTTRYERNFDQNEQMGLNDMKTENYGEKEVMSGKKEVNNNQI